MPIFLQLTPTKPPLILCDTLSPQPPYAWSGLAPQFHAKTQKLLEIYFPKLFSGVNDRKWNSALIGNFSQPGLASIPNQLRRFQRLECAITPTQWPEAFPLGCCSPGNSGFRRPQAHPCLGGRRFEECIAHLISLVLARGLGEQIELQRTTGRDHGKGGCKRS